ncbi:hypothetical protein, partial [Saccharopolyspora sp. NPDC002686]|uniref:hypothetical protein n=1 Tax=Saccharopolyspora sp. NPDC002686 TaxID=3154541 RepID=UPI0033255289
LPQLLDELSTAHGLHRTGQISVRVSDLDVIPGLYAAGAVSSTYSWCKDGGFHIADAIVFGRIAGEHAAGRAG